jgi:hypothetical protein
MGAKTLSRTSASACARPEKLSTSSPGHPATVTSPVLGALLGALLAPHVLVSGVR